MRASGKRREWPSRQRSPRTTSMITAGSVRGKCCASQPVQAVALPAERGSHGLPQTPQKRCLTRQCIRPRACASTAASPSGKRPATARRSVKLPMASGIRGKRVVGFGAVDGEDRPLRPEAEERPWPARHAQRFRGRAGDEDRFRLSFLDALHEAARAPDRHEERFGVGQRGGDEGVVLAAVGGAVEGAAGIGVAAAGGDGEHGPGPCHAAPARATEAGRTAWPGSVAGARLGRRQPATRTEKDTR